MMMKRKNTIVVSRYEAPCGTLLLGSLGDSLCLCDWRRGRDPDDVGRRLRRALGAEFAEGSSPVVVEAAAQLDAYFAGERRRFDLPILFAGTDFQKTVWNDLLRIPFGATLSYGAMARRIGVPRAVRAVANANGANSISIIVPCHRVIGSDGSLTGYGGGLEVKQFLLRHEAQFSDTLPAGWRPQHDFARLGGNDYLCGNKLSET